MTFLKYSNVSIFLYSMAVASRFVLTQAVGNPSCSLPIGEL